MLKKKEKIKNVLGLGSSNTENCKINDFYSYLPENELTHCINHTTAMRHRKVRITWRESPSS